MAEAVERWESEADSLWKKSFKSTCPHMMAVAYFIFCPKEVLLDRGREDWNTRNDLKGCPFCRRPLTP